MGFFEDINLNGEGFDFGEPSPRGEFTVDSLTACDTGIDGYLSSGRETRRVAGMKDLSGFMRVGSNLLVNKSTRDLWTLKKDANGNFIIERIESGEDENPLK